MAICFKGESALHDLLCSKHPEKGAAAFLAIKICEGARTVITASD